MKDVIYEMAREMIIPQAERFANMICGPRPSDQKEYEQWALKWNRTFHRAMDSMWRAELRRRCNNDKGFTSTSCAHPEGRTLTVGFDDPYADHARYCSEWTPMKVSTSPTKLLEQKEVEIVSLRKKIEEMERELAKYKAFWDDARLTDKMQWEKNRKR